MKQFKRFWKSQHRWTAHCVFWSSKRIYGFVCPLKFHAVNHQHMKWIKKVTGFFNKPFHNKEKYLKRLKFFFGIWKDRLGNRSYFFSARLNAVLPQSLPNNVLFNTRQHTIARPHLQMTFKYSFAAGPEVTTMFCDAFEPMKTPFM